MNTLLLSHSPHHTRLAWAKAVGAKIKILPFSGLIRFTKKHPWASFFYPLISFFYSLFLWGKIDILLVEGGSALYVAAFLTWRRPALKLIYLDCDLFFYKLKYLHPLTRFAISQIDAAISDSEQNKEHLLKHINAPAQVCPPFPKEVFPSNIFRKNYALFVGRLEPDKNIERIINFCLQCPHIEKTIIIGDGMLKAELQKKYPAVVFTGQQNDPSPYYHECKFLIHLPDADPHPSTTMEAALAGCFPIISKGTGTAYLFDELFVVEDPEDFAKINEKISFILKNEPTARELLKTSTEKFPSKETCISNFIHAFEKLS